VCYLGQQDRQKKLEDGAYFRPGTKLLAGKPVSMATTVLFLKQGKCSVCLLGGGF